MEHEGKMTEELLPCPFCGQPALLVESKFEVSPPFTGCLDMYSVRCSDQKCCDSNQTKTPRVNHIELAVSDWNTLKEYYLFIGHKILKEPQ